MPAITALLERFDRLVVWTIDAAAPKKNAPEMR